MNLEDVLAKHKSLHLDIEKSHRDMLNLQHRGNKLNEEIQKVMKPYQVKGQKLEIRINNKANFINKLMIEKYELEGIVKHLGGIIPKELQSPVIPDIPELEEDLVKDPMEEVNKESNIIEKSKEETAPNVEEESKEATIVELDLNK